MWVKRTQMYSQKADYHPPQRQHPLSPCYRHWTNHEFDSVGHPLSPIESWLLSQERIWVKFRRTRHHRYMYFFFPFCKGKAFTWCSEELESSEFIWSTGSLPNCTQSEAKRRGRSLFLYNSFLILSCPWGQYPAQPDQQEMTQNSFPGRIHGLWARQKNQEKNTNGKPTGADNLWPHPMKSKCTGLEIGFDLASKSQGIWKISKCKGPCEIFTRGEISRQVLERVSSFILLFITAGSNSSSQFLRLVWIRPVSSLRDSSQPNQLYYEPPKEPNW